MKTMQGMSMSIPMHPLASSSSIFIFLHLGTGDTESAGQAGVKALGLLLIAAQSPGANLVRARESLFKVPDELIVISRHRHP